MSIRFGTSAGGQSCFGAGQLVEQDEVGSPRRLSNVRCLFEVFSNRSRISPHVENAEHENLVDAIEIILNSVGKTLREESMVSVNYTMNSRIEV